MLRLIATLPLIATLAAAPAALAEKPAPATELVAWSDLNLSTPAGVDALMKRLGHAAKKVCGPRQMTLLYGQLAAHLDCRHQAMGEAVQRIGSPAVTLAFNKAQARPAQLASR